MCNNGSLNLMFPFCSVSLKVELSSCKDMIYWVFMLTFCAQHNENSKHGLVSTCSWMKNFSGFIFCLVLQVIITSLSGVPVFDSFKYKSRAPPQS